MSDWTILLTSGVIAAIVGGAVNLLMAKWKARYEERDRVRAVFADAYSAYAQYREFPFLIRRRQGGDSAAERFRIGETIRQTQERLSYFLAGTKIEDPEVGSAYAALVAEMRATSGVAMAEAWRTPGITSDADMNTPPDTAAPANLSVLESAYTEAASKHLKKLRPWLG
jgi:hypothetical protein